MQRSSLRNQYKSMTATERLHLVYAKAIPNQDQALMDSLMPFGTADAVCIETQKEELCMNLFAMHWLSRVTILVCLDAGHTVATVDLDNAETEKALSKQRGEKRHALCAMVWALDDFNQEHGGWLNAFYQFMNCETLIQLAIDNTEAYTYGSEASFTKYKTRYAKEMADMWNELETA